MAALNRTYLAFQYNAKLTSLTSIVRSVLPALSLEPANQANFKGITLTDDDHVVITDQTIFHPQGGGQPSDTGSMKSTNTTFTVTAVRMDVAVPTTGRVLHLGRFDPTTSTHFSPDDTVTQEIDLDKRNHYSRLHTAGHVLGAAVRHLCESSVPGFDELKASHFPDSASCEFAGLLEGKWKEPIQRRLDEYVDRDMPVEIDWWTEDDFRAHDLARLIPADRSMVAPGEKFRVVKIVGAEVYPCGGTHVDSTKLCGKTTVKRISRSKGTSKVSYTVA